MSKEYNKLAGDILEAVGGKQNVMSLQHCVTRLRFVLKNEKIAKDDVLKNMDGVATVVKSAGQYMVVIGEHVHSVFEEVCAHMGLDGKDVNKVVLAEKKKNPLQRALGFVMGALGPCLNLLCACGIIKGILVLLGLVGLPNTSGIYQLINAAGDSFFYFMPLLMGYNVARRMDFDPAFGFILAAAMCYPSIQGTPLDFFGHSVTATYTSTFLPVVFGVLIAAPIYKFFDKHIPKIVKGFVVPILTLFIAFPIAFLVVGPLANLLGRGINLVLNTIISLCPPLAGIVISGIWQVLVLFGIHGPIVSFAFFDLLSGNPSLLMALTAIPCWAVLGTCLAVCLRSKDSKLKSVALPSCVSAFFGVTEPAVYGVLLPNLSIFVYACIGAAAGGLVTVLTGVIRYSYTGMGIMSLLGLINPNGSTPFVGIALQVIVSFAVSFALTFLFFQDKAPETAAAALDTTSAAPPKAVKATLNTRVNLACPLVGEAKPLAACSDEAFSGEALGKGCVIFPTGEKVFAPCDGEVRKLFPTKHAIGLVTADGVEILIHIGIDTIRLEGKHFTAHVKQGDKITKGQPLISFNKAAIEAAGYVTETSMVITNTDDYLDVIQIAEGPVQSGTELLSILM